MLFLLHLLSEYDDDGKVIPTEIQVWKIPEVPSCSTPEPATEVQSTVGELLYGVAFGTHGLVCCDLELDMLYEIVS